MDANVTHAPVYVNTIMGRLIIATKRGFSRSATGKQKSLAIIAVLQNVADLPLLGRDVLL
jgi:hypothetical protein